MRKILPLLLCGLLAHIAWAQQPAPIAYEVTVGPNDTAFHVTVRMEGVNAPHIDFAMPTWTPGYYSMVNFARWVRNLSATAGDGKALSVETPNPYTWRVGTQGVNAVNITYDVAPVTDVIGAELQGSSITPQGAFINGTAVFGYVTGQMARPVTVEFKIPGGWRIATALSSNARSTSNTFTAPNYDTLVDSPVVLGRFQRTDVTLKDLPLAPPSAGSAEASPTSPAACTVSLVIQGDPLTSAEWTKWSGMVGRIAKTQIGIVQDAPSSYLFIFRLDDKIEDAGGLEHAHSSVIAMPKKTLLGDIFGAFTIAHTFFHQWNGKRIRPAYFHNVNYAVVPDRPHLWFFEGVTHYFAYLTFLRAGLWTPQRFWAQLMSGQQTPVMLHRRSALLGLLLDVRLRELTNNEKSLEGFLRHLNETYGKKNQPYPENGILEQLNAFAGGSNPFNDFYQRYVVQEEDLPTDEVLALAGLKLEERTVERSEFAVKLISGLKGHVQLAEVVPGGAGATAGLQVGDLLLMVDDQLVEKNLAAARGALQDKQARGTFTLRVWRPSANRKYVLQGTLEEGETTSATVVELPAPTADEQKQNPMLKPQAERHAVIRRGLLLGRNDPAPPVPPAIAIASVTPSNPAVKQDATVQVQVKITRNYDYQGDVTLALIGLPANVTAEPVTLTGAEIEATLTIKAAANAAVANTQNVIVTASTMLGTEPFTQQSAAMTLAVQAK